MKSNLFTACAAVCFLLAGAVSADPQTDEANRQRQMATMRNEAARADRSSADRSLAQQQNNAAASRSGANSGDRSSPGSSSSPNWAGGSSGTDSGPQSVVDSYTFTLQVEESTSEMLARLTAAAGAGDTGAQFNLARIYYTGFEGIPRNDARARTYFGQAAEAGHPQSQANYGFFLKEGIGGPVNVAEGQQWLKRAADAGNSFGQAQYGFALWSTDPDQAVQYLLPAADAGEMAAQALLGSLYVMGASVPQDDARGVHYLQLAAAQGEPGSAGLLGGMYLAGRGGSEAEGYALLKTGAEGGDDESMRNYGLLLVQGKGYPKDMPAGAAFIRRAAANGDAKAQMLLGDLYNDGLGVPERAEDTIYWWGRAAAAGDEEAIEAMSQVRAAGYEVGRAPTEGTGPVATPGRR